MIGHSDITQNGSPAGRVVVDTEKSTMTVYVLESCKDKLDAILASVRTPKGFELVSKVIKDVNFFDLFTGDDSSKGGNT